VARGLLSLAHRGLAGLADRGLVNLVDRGLDPCGRDRRLLQRFSQVG
jgi:hypothetical protein